MDRNDGLMESLKTVIPLNLQTFPCSIPNMLIYINQIYQKNTEATGTASWLSRLVRFIQLWDTVKSRQEFENETLRGLQATVRNLQSSEGEKIKAILMRACGFIHAGSFYETYVANSLWYPFLHVLKEQERLMKDSLIQDDRRIPDRLWSNVSLLTWTSSSSSSSYSYDLLWGFRQDCPSWNGWNYRWRKNLYRH